MRILKQNPILRLVNSYVVDSPQPTNISYLWNFGSLLALCLGLQIVTGIFLVMHYTPHTDLAFNSVEHIMRDVDYGWALRYTHANVASFFFIFVYAHIARGLYYNSYKSPRVAPWTIGVIILVLMMATFFLCGLWSFGTFVIDRLIVYFPIIIESDYGITYIFSAVPVLPFITARTRANLRIGPHNEEFLSILIGGLLGDWWGHPVVGLNYTSYRFMIEQSIVNLAYIESLALTLYSLGYCDSSELMNTSRTYEKFRLSIFTFTSLDWVYNGFYREINGIIIKGLPDWVGLYLTPLALAHWIMQDGSRQFGQGLYLATNSFTYSECVLLANILSTKYGLVTSVIKAGDANGSQWRISIWKRSMPSLASVIKPFLVPSMAYKLEGYL
jgi:ubiquinol-cytochrome c reductase cytochrome b subunit